MKYLRKAQISHAAKVLEHADPAPKDEKTFQDLSDLHPQREFPYVDCAYPLCPRLLISVEQLSKAIHEAPSGVRILRVILGFELRIRIILDILMLQLIS